MNLQEVIGLVKDIATIVAIIAGGWVAAFVYLQFTPLLSIRILPIWSETDNKWVILHLEIENKSKIRIYRKSMQIQILEHKIQKGIPLSEWVPFEKDKIIPSEKPVEWQEPIEIFRTTWRVDPGETIVVERLHYCPQGSILHIGVQVKAKLGRLGRMMSQVRGWSRQWTTTKIVMR